MNNKGTNFPQILYKTLVIKFNMFLGAISAPLMAVLFLYFGKKPNRPGIFFAWGITQSGATA